MVLVPLTANAGRDEGMIRRIIETCEFSVINQHSFENVYQLHGDSLFIIGVNCNDCIVSIRSE